ncbi:flagellar type III secretion system protein FlhB [Haliea atlantica]
MAEEQPGQERTEEPTQRRLDQAREKGQVPRSRELNTLLSLLLSAIALLALGPVWLLDLQHLLQAGLRVEPARLGEGAVMTEHLAAAVLQALLALGPLLLIAIVTAFLGPLLMGGWSFSTQAAAFDLGKVNPVKGLARVFSIKGLMELLKALAKFLLLSGVTLLLFYMFHTDMLVLSQFAIDEAMRRAASLMLWGFLALSGAMLLVAAIDVPFERWNHRRQLRMTRQEIRDELKETDGRPEVKQRIRTLQREAAQRRMMQDVPHADVVITNPTHYAVALRYSQEGPGAPRVVAKGRDLVAQHIRALAQSHDIPLFSAPPLARALYAASDIGEEIPQGLYLAVARVLAYVYQLRTAAPTDYVPRPDDLSIPAEYRRDEEPGDAD